MTARTPGAGPQVRALLALRWQMVRRPRTRVAGLLGSTALLALLGLCLSLGGQLDTPVLETVAALSPQVYSGFALLAVAAPLTSAGGSDVVPPEQLVAFPVRPSTHFLGGLLLAPLNLVWVVQLLVLAAVTGCLTAGGSLLPGLVTTALYVAAATAVGQALAWGVAGLRTSRAGRAVLAAGAAALLLAGVLLVQAAGAASALGAGPSRAVVRAVVAGGAGELLVWAAGTALLLGGLVVALGLGAELCAWSLRQPAPAAAAPARRRRAPRASALAELVAVDRASVWRAPALRRGAVVLALLPGLLAAAAELPWASLIVLPGLVAAAAGLLFGVNAFCLDGPGAVWLASLPHPPGLVARAKVRVLAETVLGAALVTALAGASRSPGTPTSAELAAVAAAVVASAAVVVAVALRTSLRSPYRADLSGPRDAVAPPGALALASLRLAAAVTLTGLALSTAAHAGPWVLPLLVGAAVTGLAGRSVLSSLRRWDDPVVRSRVVEAVARG